MISNEPWGFYLNAFVLVLSCLFTFLTNEICPKKASQKGKKHTCPVEVVEVVSNNPSTVVPDDRSSSHSTTQAAGVELVAKDDLSLISEECIEIEIPDHQLVPFWSNIDCITSCDDIEQYLMLSEFEQNLNKTREMGTRRKPSIRTFPPINELKESPKAGRRKSNVSSVPANKVDKRCDTVVTYNENLRPLRPMSVIVEASSSTSV